MSNRSKLLAGVSSLVAVGAFAAAAFVPREVCGCISPDMRFQRVFGVSAGADLVRARAAVLTRLPLGTSAAQIQAVCGELNQSVVSNACVLAAGELACACAFRTESSLLGWYERRVTLTFRVDQASSLTAVEVERSSSKF
jgi:hypothetical protein